MPARGKRELCTECRSTHGPRIYREQKPSEKRDHERYARFIYEVLGTKKCYQIYWDDRYDKDGEQWPDEVSVASE